jgi:FkbM family methyltransferase
MKPVLYHAPPIRGGSHPVFALSRVEDVDYYERSGGAPELPLILWAETIVTKDAVLIDVGANVGTWSAIWGLLGHRAYPFEANPGMAALCNDTLRRNGLLENCKSYGLSDKSCTAVLRLPIDPNSPHGRGIVQDGGASLVSNFRGGDSSPLEVQLQTLDSFDFSSEREMFLKLDVEGAELDVLRGGRRFLETHRPKILFECWEDERGQRKEELFRFLHDELKYKTVKTSWPETWIADILNWELKKPH